MNCKLLWFSLFLIIASPVFAAVPHAINYQGYLTSTAGDSINGLNNITFRLYDAPTGGILKWDSGLVEVSVANGIYTVILGEQPSSQPAINPGIFADQLWLGLTVQGDVELNPRQSLNSVGQAIRAETAEEALNADTVDGQHAADILSAALPKGAIMFFNLAACPAEWSEVVEAQGRLMVGLMTEGTLAGIVGDTLGDLEKRNHSHMADPPETTSTAEGFHTHSTDPPSVVTDSQGSHDHSVDPPDTNSSSESHNHQWGRGGSSGWRTYDFSGTGVGIPGSYEELLDTNGTGNYALTTSSSSVGVFTNNDSHSHTTDIASTTSTTDLGHKHSVDLPATISTITGDHNHTTDIAPFSTKISPGGMPYIQFLVCQKD